MGANQILFIAYLVHTGLQDGRPCGVIPNAADRHWRVRKMQEATRRARSLPGVDPAPTEVVAGDWARSLFAQVRVPAPLVVAHEPAATPVCT